MVAVLVSSIHTRVDFSEICADLMVIGYFSQWFGRRRSIVCAAIISAFMIPAWILPTSEGGLSASGFMMQFFVSNTLLYPMISNDFFITLDKLWLQNLKV